jgi:hypothetical protein
MAAAIGQRPQAAVKPNYHFQQMEELQKKRE